MKRSAYEQLAQTETTGWYYQARRRAVEKLISLCHFTTESPSILDIGCGTGGTTHSLGRFGQVTGLDSSEVALELLRAEFPELKAIQGSVEDVDTIFQNEHFSLCTILGVLYHQSIEEPRLALEKISKLQTSGDYLIWNEACYPSLERRHDRQVQGARRFTPEQMNSLLEKAGYQTISNTHLLAWAYPLASLLARKEAKAGDMEGSLDNEVQSLHPFLGKPLELLTYLEWRLSLLGIGFPFGVSCLVLAQKKN